MLQRIVVSLAVSWPLLASFALVAAEPQVPPRKLAPGVLTVVPIQSEAEETLTGPLPLVEIVNGIDGLDWTPNYTPKTETLLEKAKEVTLRRAVWNLEFAFKPVRLINVDIPLPTGKMQRKQIWYMVYRVKNIGKDLSPAAKLYDFEHDTEDKLATFQTERVNSASLRFFPHFVLSGQVLENGKYGTKEYLDRVIPAAQGPIQDRETPGRKLYNSVEITKLAIPLSDTTVDRSVWGVATWENLDPRIDFFSIYVRGLTNAYKFADPPGAYKKGQPPASGRKFTYKTLQLNFWRAGDSVLEHEEEIRYGVPLDSDPLRQKAYNSHYGVDKPLDSRWIYR